MDLVRRDELDALKAQIADLKAQVAILSAKPKGKGVKPDIELPQD